MTNAVITWFKHELGILHTEVVAIEPEIIAWAKNFLAGVTPVLREAATDAVMAAVTIPGDGSVKFAAAVATATGVLIAKGLPVVDGQIKAAIQIAYEALPDEVKGVSAIAVVNAVDTKIDETVAAVHA